jgi:hypothetical protein
MDVRLILWAILFVNILQIPQVQKVISWIWVELKQRYKYLNRFNKKWARRLFYSMKGLFNG